MGGQVFENLTRSMTTEEYNEKINMIRSRFEEGTDFLIPYRLSTKEIYNDIDLFVWDVDKFIKGLSDITADIVKIDLCSGEFSSHHILTKDGVQIDLLVAFNDEGMEIIRCYHSYSCAGVFFKKMISCNNNGYKFGYNGIQITNNNTAKEAMKTDVSIYKIPSNKNVFILDVHFLFNLIDLDYKRFTEGFKDEFEFLEYLKTSKHWYKVKFVNNSSYRRDYTRLLPFRSLCDSGLVVVLPGNSN